MARRALAVWLVAGLAVAGCSALTACASEPPVTAATTPPATAATAPTGGVLLTDEGMTFAPAGFSIPAGLTPASTTDLSQLVTVVFDGADGPFVYRYLTANLDGMGCPVTASSTDSITWNCGEWAGGFTMTPSQAALTLRRMAG